jgi:SNF2 family DNA or RNA helicase
VEVTGGIVADEMGLGKTLTMLAAITASLDSALTYARFLTKIDGSGRGVWAAKSTLVIVPSTCMYGGSKSSATSDLSSVLISSWLDEVER